MCRVAKHRPRFIDTRGLLVITAGIGVVQGDQHPIRRPNDLDGGVGLDVEPTIEVAAIHAGPEGYCCRAGFAPPPSACDRTLSMIRAMSAS